jgi:WD40 repeat protein
MKLIYILSLGLLVSGFNLQNIWRKDKISYSYLYRDGRSQYLSVKNGCMAYFNIDVHKLFYYDNKTLTLQDVHRNNFICDIDIEKWNGDMFKLTSYYDSKRHQYIALFPFSDRFFHSVSRIVRCFLLPSEDHLLGVIVTANGEVFKLSYDHKYNITYSSTSLPFSVYMVEFYEPYLYIVDSHQQFHIYCPVLDKVILSKDFLPSPVVHFSVLSGKKMAFALLDQTVRILSMNDENNRVLKMEQPVKKIHIDEYKCVVLLEDGTLSVYDVNSGELWYEKKMLMDPSYTTRLHASHQSIYIDGHREGLVKIDSGQKSIKELDDLAKWVNVKFSKPPPSPFLTALMNTPPYNLTENTQLNWSWPQP